jgi:IG-like fold at C-terminal of FixG, putative oxidoreductase
VLRDRNALYRETADSVENDYLLKIANKTMQPQRYRIALVAPDGIALRGAPVEVRADAEEMVSTPITAASGGPVAGRRNVRFIIVAGDGTRVEVDSTFFGPSP